MGNKSEFDRRVIRLTLLYSTNEIKYQNCNSNIQIINLHVKLMECMRHPLIDLN